jgi:fermentation-respiration switch protein FrsA (DUF1100 family)
MGSFYYDVTRGIANHAHNWYRSRVSRFLTPSKLTLLSLILLLNGCAPTRLFYHPNKVLYLDPAKLSYTYDMMRFPSLNGKKLFGLLFRTQQDPKGIVVHLHGNYGNVSNHFLGTYYLVNHGFDVLVIDYEGFGDSEGRPTPKRTIEDGRGAVRFAKTLNRNPSGGIVLVGQSLGGAVAIPVMAQEPDVKAAVIESAFTSYRSIARDVTKRSVITWLAYPIYPWMLPTAYDPVKFVAKISPRPLLFIHGTADRVVPAWMSQELFDRAQEPKSIWLLNGVGHIEGRHKEGEVYEKRVADFLTNALTPPTNK